MKLNMAINCNTIKETTKAKWRTKVIVKKLFELPMLSSLLNSEPEILIKGLDISMILDGKDLSDADRHVCLSFKSVLCHKHTSERFTEEMYDAYDAVVEIVDSEWLIAMEKINKNDFGFWKPRHFAVYLEGIGLYQFIARSFEETVR